MLEKLPHIIGEKLQGKGPGLDKTMYFDVDFAGCPEDDHHRQPRAG